ncbi:MAG: dockerin type I repeat-containing protein [Phycisphaerales bacterium]|nr:dockerin type I repeat-containing protein [Phycisphaerales bacterium]
MRKQSLFAIALAFTAAPALANEILQANPGPQNNGGGATWAIFFDLEASSQDLTVTALRTASLAAAGAPFSIDVWVRSGTALGGPVATGPGSDPSGWTLLGNAPAMQGPEASGISEIIDIPEIEMQAGDQVGVALVFRDAAPAYFGIGTPPYGTYADANLTLTTGDVRSQPFTTGGNFFSSRELVGELHYTTGAPTCPADLNGDGVVDADDFFLFLQLFADGDTRADINGDGVIDADDFFEYLALFAAGC